jgi:hypothetical protein
MADQHDLVAAAMMEDSLLVHLGDERTCRIEEKQVLAGRARAHVLRHPMRGEHHRSGRVRDLVKLLDEDGALVFQALHDVAVMHDLVADIDRRAETLQSAFDDLNGTFHASAEAARRAEQDVAFR